MLTLQPWRLRPGCLKAEPSQGDALKGDKLKTQPRIGYNPVCRAGGGSCGQ